MSNFKIVLTAIFAICLVVGIALFALSRGGTSTQTARLTVWGTIPNEVFDAAYKASSIAKDKTIVLTYVKKDPTTFDTDFIGALADGKGPDIVLIRDDSVYKHSDKFLTVPYKNYTERTFKDTFIEEGEVYLTPDGVLSFPFIVDPLVMYWNRDMFSSALVSTPPQYWDEFYSLIDKMTVKDSSATITQSALAFGEWRNITNAKEIIEMLMMQSGTPITTRYQTGVQSVLNNQFNYPVVPSEAAVNFYTQFANPTSATYTWNRSLPISQNFFLSGKLATYIGFASEIYSIQQKNPNLNFDVTYVPQIRDTTKKIVFAHMYSFSIVKQSQNPGPAFLAINALTQPVALSAMEKLTNLPPVRRDMLVNKPTDDFRIIFYNSALLSHTWIDPDGGQTGTIFRDMIESITSGRSRVSEALGQANDSLTALLK